MIIRLSARLARKIRVSDLAPLPADPNPFADWSCHLFTAERVQYILITNTPSLYSMVMYGRGITDDGAFLKRVTSYMGEFMRDDGHAFIYERLVAPAAATVTFSKALSRRVTDSMNDLVFQAKIHLEREEISPYDLSFRLNETPMSYLGYDNPRRAFHSLGIEDASRKDGERS